MRSLLLLLAVNIAFLVGCVERGSPTPEPEPDDPTPITKNSAEVSIKTYSLKASEVFAEAAIILKRDKNIQAIHDFLKSNLTKERSESFKGLDNRLNEVLGVENPDIDAAVDLLNEISQEFKEASK